ncbi:uncharacterized protein LOC117172457 [Belonocnema kinseyi]|uniref:uncharacterized protein LOC117172457 n=1 Tax=Belonocnema kinseyi TaxID=2817044 RepID=UPI00143D0DA6|nr:uncharacterized protein LOC117172457 [Belonocnema kinseyi]XP_033216302.1 uncharacterized protein LOC117172457 [Belonocnema kinseyi]
MHVGAPLLTLAIFFSFIELSSQQNEPTLTPDSMTLHDTLGIYYSITNKIDILIIDGHNEDTFGLLHEETGKLVCALELDSEDQVWVRKLMTDEGQVTADESKTYPWTQGDTDLYNLKFDAILS